MSLLLKGTEEITLPLKGEVTPVSRETTTVNGFENKQLDLLAHLPVLSVTLIRVQALRETSGSFSVFFYGSISSSQNSG